MISKNQLRLIRQMEAAKHRRAEGLFLAEGPKVVGDLLVSGRRPRLLLATEEWQAPCECSASVAACGVQRVSDEELCRASLLQHPREVLALFPLEGGGEAPSPQRGELCLALDGVQDPGNVGTIIRIADWYGIERIYCSPDTADCFAPKVVQATMGSIARVAVYYCDLPQMLSQCGLPVLGTLLDGDDLYAQRLPLENGAVLVMGSEGHGLSPDVRKLLTHRLFIPCHHRGASGPESLNVAIATAVVCAELRRR